MRVIGLLTTYPPEELHEAVAVISDFTNVRVRQNKQAKLEISLAD